MKNIIFTMALFAIGIFANSGIIQETVAGPFGKQGQWVSREDGINECVTNIWKNECKVGSFRDSEIE
jgi:hypothetical protein